MKLSELAVGESAEVTSVGSEPAVRRRIMDLGLIKGARFTVLRVAPLGDPVEIVCRGMLLTMRKQEAEGIRVRKVAPDSTLNAGQSRTRGWKRYGWLS
jgi:ferrous iron transport protein A